MGALWMLVAGFLFGCMGVFVKLGADYFSNIELVFYRSFIGLIIMYAILRQRGGSMATPHWKSHLMRGVSGTMALLLFFYCITVLPLATAVTLNYTSPLFLAVLITLVFRERFHPPLIIAIALGFVGMILLLHPTLQRNQITPGLLGLISGFFAGIAMLNVRELARSGEPEICDKVLIPLIGLQAHRGSFSPRSYMHHDHNGHTDSRTPVQHRQPVFIVVAGEVIQRIAA